MARVMQLIAALMIVCSLAPSAAAQQQGAEPRQAARGGRGGNPPNAAAGAGVQELQQMFDAFALVQAQRVLQLSDEQYQRFFVRMNRLQDLRGQQNRQRMRLLNELRRMTGPQGNADDAALTTTLQNLDAQDLKFAEQLRAARQGIDEVLTVRQRALFRFFEEDMERRKIDYLTRARQGGRE